MKNEVKLTPLNSVPDEMQLFVYLKNCPGFLEFCLRKEKDSLSWAVNNNVRPNRSLTDTIDPRSVFITPFNSKRSKSVLISNEN